MRYTNPIKITKLCRKKLIELEKYEQEKMLLQRLPLILQSQLHQILIQKTEKKKQHCFIVFNKQILCVWCQQYIDPYFLLGEIHVC